MYNLAPSLKVNLLKGPGTLYPHFDVLSNRSSNKPTYDFFATSKQYEQMLTPKEKIPRMHSWCVPNYLNVRRMQEIGQRDDGYRIYEKFPLQRAWYRFTWLIILGSTGYTALNVFFFLKEN